MTKKTGYKVPLRDKVAYAICMFAIERIASEQYNNYLSLLYKLGDEALRKELYLIVEED